MREADVLTHLLFGLLHLLPGYAKAFTVPDMEFHLPEDVCDNGGRLVALESVQPSFNSGEYARPTAAMSFIDLALYEPSAFARAKCI